MAPLLSKEEYIKHRRSSDQLSKKHQNLEQSLSSKQSRLADLEKKLKSINIEKKTIDKKTYEVSIEKNEKNFAQKKKDFLELNKELKAHKEKEKEAEEKRKKYESTLEEIEKLKETLLLDKEKLSNCEADIHQNKRMLDEKLHSMTAENKNHYEDHYRKSVEDWRAHSGSESGDEGESSGFSEEEGGIHTKSRYKYSERKYKHTSSYHREGYSTSGSGEEDGEAEEREYTTEDESLNFNRVAMKVMVVKYQGLRPVKNFMGTVKPYVVLTIGNQKEKTGTREGYASNVGESFVFRNVNLKKGGIIMEVKNQFVLKRQRFGIKHVRFSDAIEFEKLKEGKNMVNCVVNLEGEDNEGEGKVALKICIKVVRKKK